jgi:hypothetical protein
MKITLTAFLMFFAEMVTLYKGQWIGLARFTMTVAEDGMLLWQVCPFRGNNSTVRYISTLKIAA